MKEEVKKKIIIFASLFITLGVIALLITSLKNKEVVSKIELLDNDDKYFSIKSTINNYINDEETDYIITKILYKSYKGNDYCLINGYKITYQEFGEPLYEDNINYLMILRGNTYNLSEINTNNIENYIESYNDYKDINDGKVLDVIKYSEKNKLSSYISNFINLIIFDSKKAKNYLKDPYDNLSKYNNLSSNIISYTKNDNSYIITDSNNNTFKIIEESTMNYKIEL